MRAETPGFDQGIRRTRAGGEIIEQPLAAGEVISTGTLTDALPVKPGETWSTEIGGLPLQNLTISYTD